MNGRLLDRRIFPSGEPAQQISFEETEAVAGLGWHNALHRQYVITLGGGLGVEMRFGIAR